MQFKTADKCIYAIQCKESKRVYIGCTCDIRMRVNSHFTELKNGKKKVQISFDKYEDSLWQSDYNEYGRSGFEIFVIEENIPYEESMTRESHYIKIYNSAEPQFGYNRAVCSRQPIDLIYGAPEVPHE